MHFASPWFLLALPAPILLTWLKLHHGRQRAGAVRFSDLRALAGAPGGIRAAAWQALPLLRATALCLLIVALARPHQFKGLQELETEGIDMVLALDVSGSMSAEDMGGATRLTAAKQVVEKFIEGLRNDRVGLVVFAGRAFTQCPLTLDYGMVQRLLGQVRLGMVEDGTAIGMALATAASRLKDSEAKSKLIILLTDGQNNRGEIDPLTAAKAAEALGIKVYAIGVGSEKGVPIPQDVHPIYGVRYRRNPDGSLQLSKLDVKTLKEIARLSGGQFFRADDPSTLRRVYDDIWKMEKSKFQVRAFQRYRELFAYFLWPGLALLLLEIVLSQTWLRKLP